MAKEVPWFRHDMNARRDPKLVALRRAKGFDGLGRWWVIVEVLREQTYYRLPDCRASYDLLSEELYCSPEEAQQFVAMLIDNLGLCEKIDGYIQSPALTRRMEAWEARHQALSEAGRRGAEARLEGKRQATPQARLDDSTSQAQARLNSEGSLAQATLEENASHPQAMELGDLGEKTRGEEASSQASPAGSQRRAPDGPPARVPVQHARQPGEEEEIAKLAATLPWKRSPPEKPPPEKEKASEKADELDVF